MVETISRVLSYLLEAQAWMKKGRAKDSPPQEEAGHGQDQTSARAQHTLCPLLTLPQGLWGLLSPLVGFEAEINDQECHDCLRKPPTSLVQLSCRLK